MIVAGRPRLVLDRDGWTIRTRDGALSTHEEHTVVVGSDGPLVIA
jgi:methionyl aminopeptidase